MVIYNTQLTQHDVLYQIIEHYHTKLQYFTLKYTLNTLNYNIAHHTTKEYTTKHHIISNYTISQHTT